MMVCPGWSRNAQLPLAFYVAPVAPRVICRYLCLFYLLWVFTCDFRYFSVFCTGIWSCRSPSYYATHKSAIRNYLPSTISCHNYSRCISNLVLCVYVSINIDDIIKNATFTTTDKSTQVLSALSFFICPLSKHVMNNGYSALLRLPRLQEPTAIFPLWQLKCQVTDIYFITTCE